MRVSTCKSGTASSLLGVTWSGTQYVAVGYGGVVVASPDGVEWTSRVSRTANLLAAVAWSGTQFVAVGYAVLTSADAITWTARVSQTPHLLYGVAWSGTEFVAVGSSGTILASPDGVEWTPRASGTRDALQGIVWSGTRFVAVGSGGTILTSEDGVAWTARNPNRVSMFLTGVAWSGTRLVAAGVNDFPRPCGQFLSSSDGATWTPHALDTSEEIQSVAWTGTQFVAVGGSADTGSIFTSPHGTAWAQQPSGSSNALYGIACSTEDVVVVGVRGAILRLRAFSSDR